MVKKKDATYLFKYLLLSNFLQYLEAGAVPALLISLAQSFQMSAGEQGLLGGVVYLSLGFGSPFAGYLLRNNDHKLVIGCAVAANMILALFWALTPVGYWFSTFLFISFRFLMGLCQCIICVFLPLWANENAPKDRRTAWMSYLQASVPLGVMVGYIIAAISLSISQSSATCGGLLCWRWPILIEIFLLSPLYIGLYFVPGEHISLQLSVTQDRLITNTENGSIRAKDSNDSLFQTPIQVKSLETTPLLDQTRRTVQSATPRKMKTPQERESEKKLLSDYRRNSIRASIYDPLSIRDVIKRSSDDLVVLGAKDDVFDLLPGFHWSHRHSQHRHPSRPKSGGKHRNNENEHDLFDNENRRHSMPTLRESQAKSNNPTKLDHLHISPRQKRRLNRSSSASAASEIPEYESFRDIRKKSMEKGNGYFHFRSFLSPESSVGGGRRRSSSTSVVDSYLQYDNLSSHTTPTPGSMTKVESLRYGRKIHLARSNSDEQLAKYSDPLNLSTTEELYEKSVDPTRFHPVQLYSTFDSQDRHFVDKNNNLHQSGNDIHIDNNHDEEKTLIEDHFSYQEGFEAALRDSPRTDDDDESSESEYDSDWDNFPAISPEKTAINVLSTPSRNPSQAMASSSCFDLISNSRFQQRSELWFASIKALLRVHVYRNLLGAMTALYFTVTGVQYWGTKYLTVSLNAPLALVNFLFIFSAATAPTTGVLFGGWLIDSFGGYRGHKQSVIALEIVSILGVLAFIFSLPITFLSNIYNVVLCLWFVLFFGASALPACSGILVSIVPRIHRTTSSSLSLVVFNMFGYFLSLILSGYLMETLEYYSEYCDVVCSMTWGFRLVLFWSVFAVAFLILALFASYRRLDERSKKYSSQYQEQRETQQQQQLIEDSSVTNGRQLRYNTYLELV